jgi:hypothetical protein
MSTCVKTRKVNFEHEQLYFWPAGAHLGVGEIFFRLKNVFFVIFKLRECAQSIPRLEKRKNRRFSHKNPKMFDFRFNTPIPSLNQGQGSVFKVWECAQSILRMKLPPEIWFFQNFSIFASIHTSISLNQGQGSFFTLREYAQSIPRIRISLKTMFWEIFRKKIFFEKMTSKNYKICVFFGPPCSTLVTFNIV